MWIYVISKVNWEQYYIYTHVLCSFVQVFYVLDLFLILFGSFKVTTSGFIQVVSPLSIRHNK